MKKIFSSSILLLICTFVLAQEAETKITDSANTLKKETYIKANAVFLPIGMLNAGIETQLSKKYTLQGDVFISPWKSFAGKFAQIYMTGIEGRYYFDQAFKHWYVGANFSFARYKMQKWNYWGDQLVTEDGNPIPYKLKDTYQNGFNLFLGATIGYQWQIDKKWNFDLFLGGGWTQGFYKGYHKNFGRYDTWVKNWNKSGEWLPYKGGLMISYKLK